MEKKVDKKKIIAIVIAIVVAIALIFAFVGCEKEKPSNETLNTETPKIETPAETTTEQEDKKDEETTVNKETEDKTDKEETTNSSSSTSNSSGNSSSSSSSSSNGSSSSSSSGNSSSSSGSSSSSSSSGSSSSGGSSSSSGSSGSTKPSEPSKPTHTHSYGEWKTTKAPTCTGAGTQERSCSCGKTETRSVSAKGHKWESKTVTVEVEENHVFCNGCGYDYGEYPEKEKVQLPDGTWGDAFDRHMLYDENGNERTDEGFSLHAAYHDDYVMVKKEATKTICTVCGMEK